MIDTTLVAIAAIAIIPQTIIALATLRAARRNATATVENTAVTVAAATVTADLAKKQDAIIEKTTEIHTQTNGTLHKVNAQLLVATERIEGLEKLVSTLAAEKVSIAAAAAGRVEELKR